MQGVVLVYHNIRDQPGATVDAFKQIMAKQGVWWYAIQEALLKCVYVVNAFAHEDAGTEEILVSIGDGQRIQIQFVVARKDARK